MIVHVRNFGKIEKADINLSDLIIFVGENNSGKTYLMQLIYGLFSFFGELGTNLNNDMNTVFREKKTQNGEITICAHDIDFYNSFQNALNDYIMDNMDKIIESTFHTNALSIESLSVEFQPLADDYSITYNGPVQNEEDGIFKHYSLEKNRKLLSSLGFGETMTDDIIDRFLSKHLFSVLMEDLIGLSINKSNQRRNEKSFIYFPASRSGMMLLYSNYLSHDVKNSINDIGDYSIEQAEVKSIENEYGLTEPVYNFLMFLLNHKYSEIASKQNHALISFIENSIINGHLEKVGNAMIYKPDNSEQLLPIQLSSSLVSELAPLYQALTGIHRISYIMYDEIETCQHPTKQIQLARLIIRMLNSGYKMIVSSHSDTMVTAINNLITLSYKERKSELLDKLNYTEEDILQHANVNAYQFVIQNGRTNVVEVPNHFSVGVGFNFDLFNTANQKIYDDAVSLSEVD